MLLAACIVPIEFAARAAVTPPHIMIVVMENASYEGIVGNSSMPFVNSQLRTNGYVSTVDLTHPSLPNYLGLTSGSIYNNPQDTTPQDRTYPGPQFTDELAAAAISWKAYAEDMPVACDLTDQFGPNSYDVNHNPFMYYTSIRSNPTQCNRDVPYPQLATDLSAGTAPSFIWVTPNLIDDMHDGTPAQGDAFLKALVTQVEASSWWTAASRIIVTWDEGATTENVLTLVIGSAHGTAMNGGNGYGTLRGLEEAYGVGLLGNSASSSVGDILPLLTGAAASQPPAAPAPSPAPVSAPATGIRGIYRFTSTDFASMRAAGFNAATDGGVQDNAVAERSNGLTGMVWVDAYDNATCTQTMTTAAIQSMVQADVTAGYRGLRYQIGDEPTANGCNAAPVYRSITQAVHAVDLSAKTWVADDQFQVGNAPQSGIPMMGSVDILAFDIYPCQTGASCDYSAIDSAVRQIHAAGLTSWEFIIQDFNEGSWRWPTPAEIEIQFRHWQNQGALGYWVFAWDYVGQQVIDQPGNVAALQWINSQPGGAPGTNASAGAQPGTNRGTGAGTGTGAAPSPTSIERQPSPSAGSAPSPASGVAQVLREFPGSGWNRPTAVLLTVLGSILASGIGGSSFVAWRRRRHVSKRHRRV